MLENRKDLIRQIEGKQEHRTDIIKQIEVETRTVVEDLRTWVLMPSASVTEAESRPDRTFSTFTDEKNPKSSRVGVCQGKIGTERDELGT